MSRRGFTLVEVIVALTLSSLVVLLGHAVFTGVVDGAACVREARAALDRVSNAERWLTEAFGSLDVGGPAGGFEGTPSEVRFATWLATPERGFVSSRVVLAAHDERLVAAIGGQDSLVLRDSVSVVGFDYLLETGASARWVGTWRSPVTAPVAVRLRVTRLAPVSGGPQATDTLLLPIGPRG